MDRFQMFNKLLQQELMWHCRSLFPFGETVVFFFYLTQQSLPKQGFLAHDDPWSNMDGGGDGVGQRPGFSFSQPFLSVASLYAIALISFREEHRDSLVSMRASVLHQTGPRRSKCGKNLHIRRHIPVNPTNCATRLELS